jgi:predicted Ser/Thr protein kinase
MSKSSPERDFSAASNSLSDPHPPGAPDPARTGKGMQGAPKEPDLDDIIADLFGFPADRTSPVEKEKPRLSEGDSTSPGAGTRLGRCRLQSPIGQGRTGVVWKAWHTTLEIPVAVKLLPNPDDRNLDAKIRERFRQEARIAALVDPANLVHVLDFGEDLGHHYLVMELVEGTTLESWLEERKFLDEKTALNAIEHICLGLAELHYVGVVHQDIKPSNILVDPGGSLKISDLGLARLVDGSIEMAGTPHFMAPECQDAGTPSDHRSDLYAVGVILYRMIMGRLPFMGAPVEVLYAHLNERPDMALPEGSAVDTGALFILRRLLEKKPEQRMRTAREVVQACRDQLRRLDTRERLRAERVARPAPVAEEMVREAARSTLAERMRKGIDKVLLAAMRTWVPWVSVGIVLAVVAFLVLR